MLVLLRLFLQEAVTSIIFCVALSEYDQNLLEESGQVRSSYISREGIR
jgi:hypothetical protein